MASLTLDSLLYDNDQDATPTTWYKLSANSGSTHCEPDNSLANWTIQLGQQRYLVHQAIIGQGTRASGYFNGVFKRWCQQGSSETDLSLSLPPPCLHAWEEVLDFVYGGDGSLVPSNVVSQFKIAHFLQMPTLMRLCIDYIKGNLTCEATGPMLRKALALSPGLDAIVHKCIQTLALELNNCETESFFKLPVETLSTILELATDEFSAEPLKISNVVAACIRDLDDDGSEQSKLLHGLAKLLTKIAPEDALLLLGKSIEFSHDGIRQLCLPAIASSFDDLNSDDLAMIPNHQTVCEILDQDDLMVSHEDQVFDAILSYCNAKSQLTSDQRKDIWKTCRFLFLSAKCIVRIMGVPDMPVEFVKLALVGTQIQREKGWQGLKELAQAPDYQSWWGRHWQRRKGCMPSALPDMTIPFWEQLETWLPGKRLHLLYRGSRDGFEASTFHEKCDNQGSTLTLVQSTKDNIFGGYAVTAWCSAEESQRNDGGWLFSLKNPSGTAPVQIFVTNQPEEALFDSIDYGPSFGGADSYSDLCIADNCNVDGVESNTELDRGSYNLLGASQDFQGDNRPCLFEGETTFTVREIEVYQVLL